MIPDYSQNSAIVQKQDMRMVPRILPYSTPQEIPLEMIVDGRTLHGIPDDFHPTVTRRLLDCNLAQVIVEGQRADGLDIRAEYIEYRDFPVTEWVVYVSNRSNRDSALLENIRISGTLAITDPVLTHGNGDTCNEGGYSFTDTPVQEPIHLTPTSGTSCQGAFPYMTLHGSDCEIRIAIGWPTKWVTDFAPGDGGVRFSAGQDRCCLRLYPGETFRTPRVNLMAYRPLTPYRGINMWRHWYFKHILPRENGQPIPAKLCLHNWMADGKPEFTGATEENQIRALEDYIRRDMKPDIWWMDAGWYPCDYDWPRIGTWMPDPVRFPRGMTPLGEACEKNDVQFMVWFEPERVVAGERLEREHPEWLLWQTLPNGEKNTGGILLDLSNPDALDWLCRHVSNLITTQHIAIYRQDFNYDPLPVWEQNEAPERIGVIENQHGQGYLAYWDYLIYHHPGLWIDSCASGGRRNDLETMRRAVPLHYTDVGYGNHPIKQKQHREMFEWIPYFRAHNMNWDNPNDGTYVNGGRPTDVFAFHCAMAPALTSMFTYNDSEKNFEIGRKMDKIWREAATLELEGDYYPMTECRADPHDFYAMQFDDADHGRGFFQVIRNTLVAEDTYRVLLPCIHEGHYTFTNRETQETMSKTAEELKNGFDLTLEPRSGQIWFYTVE